MKHLKSVKVYDGKRSHWITSAPLNATVEWDAEIVDDREDGWIAWRSVEGAGADNSGSIYFQPAQHDRGTGVKVVMEYKPPAGAIGAAIARLFGKSPEQQLGDDLRRFKMSIETGDAIGANARSNVYADVDRSHSKRRS